LAAEEVDPTGRGLLAWGSRWHRWVLALIVLASAALATVWVFFVPIFQAPDESVHFDYALLMNARRGILRATRRTFEEYPVVVHPYTFYLIERVNSRKVACHPDVRMPPDYGTLAFFRDVDREAPAWDCQQFAPNSLRANVCSIDPRLHAWDPRKVEANQLIAVNPYGYYAVLALWLEGLRGLKDRPVFLFFGCRLLSVLLLVCTLLLSHGTARLLRLPPRLALALTGAVGLFPLTSFVASYVQPDNLCFTLIMLACYLSLHLRKQWPDGAPLPVKTLALLGVALGGLLVTKMHFFLCTALPVAALLAVEAYLRRLPWRQKSAGLALLVAPSLLTGGVYLWSVRGSCNYYSDHAATQGRDGLGHTLLWLHRAISDYYSGLTHESFYGIFGWLDTPLTIGGGHTQEVVRCVILFFLLVAAGADAGPAGAGRLAAAGARPARPMAGGTAPHGRQPVGQRLFHVHCPDALPVRPAGKPFRGAGAQLVAVPAGRVPRRRRLRAAGVNTAAQPGIFRRAGDSGAAALLRRRRLLFTADHPEAVLFGRATDPCRARGSGAAAGTRVIARTRAALGAMRLRLRSGSARSLVCKGRERKAPRTVTDSSVSPRPPAAALAVRTGVG
jgi:hypothetical protein